MSRKMERLIFGMGIVFGWSGLYAQSLPNRAPLPSVTATAENDSFGKQPLVQVLPGGDNPNGSRCLATTTIQMAANPSVVQLGQSSNLNWSVEVPDGCDSLTIKLNGLRVAATGHRTITPTQNTRFSLVVNAGRPGGFAQRGVSAEVQVGFPERVIIDERTPDPVSTLIGALVDSTNPVQVVELCNVELDFTGQSQIVIGANRSLIASPACARGPRSFGPRIFVTDKRNGSTPLFVIRASNVLFSGFRLEGPTPGIESDDGHQEVGIQVFPFDFPIQNVEISNMEISHWSGAGIRVTDNSETLERGRLTNENVGAVRIRNNFLHHNRHYEEGYGVQVADGAYALIEQNVFEENRHAIAGGSSNGKTDFSGYTARDNLILPGGGLQCKIVDVGIDVNVGCWQTHQIDMHGDTTSLGSSWCCGTAGETMIIQRNTILYTGGLTPYALHLGLTNGPLPVFTSGYAIKIRGNPADKAVVDDNVFKHSSRGDAIAQNGDGGFPDDKITNPIDVRPDNVFGFDPTAENLPSCDFAGDGQLDQFMATGVTWWAKSPTTLQWRYLNTMPERLSDIQLGHFDNDSVCDVVPRSANPFILRGPKTYSKSGMGPWVPFLVTAQ